MFSEALGELLGAPPRVPGSEITQFHKDMARSTQLVLEEILLSKVRYLHSASRAQSVHGGRGRTQCRRQFQVSEGGPIQTAVRPTRGG